jgi:hypothetical protein
VFVLYFVLVAFVDASFRVNAFAPTRVAIYLLMFFNIYVLILSDRVMLCLLLSTNTLSMPVNSGY